MDNHKQMPWHTQKLEEVYERLRISEKGLSDAEAVERLRKHGRNELRSKSPKTMLQVLRAQIMDPMVLILLSVAVCSVLLQEWTEAVVTFTIVIINVATGIVQERKAQSSLEVLCSMSAPTAWVLWQGEESIVPASELMVGDVVPLEDGDMASTDMRPIDSVNSKAQEASLTGESAPSEKGVDELPKEDCMLGDRSNMVYTPAAIIYGRATGVVVATGMDTEAGNITGMLDNQDELDTPLKRELNAVGKTLMVAGLIVCVLILLIGALYQRPLVPQFLVAMLLTISVIPEELPTTTIIVMALSVQRMVKKNVLIRKLPIVEALDSTTAICFDKTGTLTLNRMTVIHIAANGDFEEGRATPVCFAVRLHPEVYQHLVYAAALCNNASPDPNRRGEIIGDPTEGALVYMAQAFGTDHEALEAEYPRFREQSFDSDWKRMTMVHRTDSQWKVYIKGAADETLPLCTYVLTAKGIRPITEVDRGNIAGPCLQMLESALRMLRFAMRILPVVPQEDEEDLESDTTFVRAAGMIDPPRREVAESMHICLLTGIRIIMITGDHKTMALAVIEELGIYREGNTVISGDELDCMSDNELNEAVKTTTAFARVLPVDKLRVIQSLKRTGEMATMTGDGVNDSPALKAADIGVAMGVTGTDVTKDAFDMILLDDSFTTIAYVIKEGRRVYRNTQKVIQFLLMGNTAEITTLFVATIFNWGAPLLAVHILWVSPATATLPVLALGADPASKSTVRHQPIKFGTPFEEDLVWWVVTQGIFVAALAMAVYWIGVRTGNHTVGQTMAFCMLAFSQMLRAFNQRSNTEPIWVWAEGFNLWLSPSFAVSLLLILCILFVPTLQRAFRLAPMGGREQLVVIGLSPLSIVQVGVGKVAKRLG